jgi:hypothetical protein
METTFPTVSEFVQERGTTVPLLSGSGVHPGRVSGTPGSRRATKRSGQFDLETPVGVLQDEEHIMNSLPATSCDSSHYELRYRSLVDERHAFAFPCNASGIVDMDSLSERVRHNYLYARAVVGREFSRPDVQPRKAPGG